ncbi:hypothetical protein [Vibrio vulnificus]|nr:hypothetical protein [Vibrio vulnificus]
MPQHKLEQAIAAFDHWRQNRTKRTHAPNELRKRSLLSITNRPTTAI